MVPEGGAPVGTPAVPPEGPPAGPPAGPPEGPPAGPPEGVGTADGAVDPDADVDAVVVIPPPVPTGAVFVVNGVPAVVVTGVPPVSGWDTVFVVFIEFTVFTVFTVSIVLVFTPFSGLGAGTGFLRLTVLTVVVSVVDTVTSSLDLFGLDLEVPVDELVAERVDEREDRMEREEGVKDMAAGFIPDDLRDDIEPVDD